MVILHGIIPITCSSTASTMPSPPPPPLTLVVADGDGDDDLVLAATSSPAARHVEELHIEVADVEDSYRSRKRRRRRLSFGAMSSSVLRVLRVTGSASPLPLPPRGTFPRLGEIHLNKCTVPLHDLQATIDAAPKLATLHMESCCLKHEEENEGWKARVRRSYRLICPAICNRFVRKLPAASDMIQVDLHLFHDSHAAAVSRKKDCMAKLFWKFIRNFSTTSKLLKLKLDFGMDMVFRPEETSTSLFQTLEQLELDVEYNPTGEASVSALAMLLHCCPVVRDIRLKLSKDLASRIDTRSSIDLVARADYDKSVDRFRHRYRASSQHSLDGEDDGHTSVLSEQSFRFMESCLRRVSLQFCMDKPNCLGVKLAKFFVEKAIVLEELHIDDGSHKLLEHINASVSDKMNC
ncbi:hypothetical protein HU200_049049 [Digitaria exilis]|uniref:F-box/LRR-repeat protein 15/At3g58940/PEG3-like LRR domain-containing protein n=1 Tax=Digitaria exilis TaxID=1010633 RepID=A0A835AR42_9POAL|nr:hypothetical protein HU200_049049 [Digitaria exilis]